MRRFDMEKMLLAYELEQLLYDFAEELDLREAAQLEKFYAPEAVFHAGPVKVDGLEAIKGFYRNRNENVKKHQRDGQRTGRHTFLNVRVHIHDADSATLLFTNANYACEGPAPASGLIGPSAIADCRMECRRQADGNWLFTEFAPKQALLGEDDFMKLMLSLNTK